MGARCLIPVLVQDAMFAMLHARLSLASDTPVPLGPSEIRIILPGDDAAILGLAAERNPDLAAMAAEPRGREDALALAKIAWLHDLGIGCDVIPKTSSRAITSPAGAADAMETLAPVELDLPAMRRVVDLRAAGVARVVTCNTIPHASNGIDVVPLSGHALREEHR